MELRAKFAGLSKDWLTNKWKMTLELENDTSLIDMEKYKEGLLDIAIKKHRNKRSLNANAYAWVLLQKLAEAVGTDRDSMYIQELRKWSRSFTFIVCKEEAIPRLREQYRAIIDLGNIKVGSMEGHQLQVFFGSSTFDTKEMAVFIDGLVTDCKELDIETLPPDEIERMKAQWNL